MRDQEDKKCTMTVVMKTGVWSGVRLANTRVVEKTTKWRNKAVLGLHVLHLTSHAAGSTKPVSRSRSRSRAMAMATHIETCCRVLWGRMDVSPICGSIEPSIITVWCPPTTRLGRLGLCDRNYEFCLSSESESGPSTTLHDHSTAIFACFCCAASPNQTL